MLTSPNALLFESIIARINSKVPEIRYIDQDLGQLENYETRPAVSWPCLLIDIEDTKFSDVAGKLHQLAEGVVCLRLGLVQYSNSSSITPASIRANALKYYEVENAVYTALYGWSPAGFSRMLRVMAATEKRDDDIRVRVLKFKISYTDTSAEPVYTTINRPDPTIIR